MYKVELESKVATLMAGRLGKAIWLDLVSGLYSSSQYYFPKGLPSWVNMFNKQNPVPKTVTWNSVYPVGSAAYQFPNAQNYSGSLLPFINLLSPIPLPETTLFNTTLPAVFPSNPGTLIGALIYSVYPQGIQKYFQFVKHAIDVLYSSDPNSRLVLFLNVNAIDVISGLLGPQTQEVIDLVYQLDLELQGLLEFVGKKVPMEEFLFVLCNDEGRYPAVPEILQKQGFDLATRTEVTSLLSPDPPLIERLNTYLISTLPDTPTDLKKPWAYGIVPPFIYMNAINPDRPRTFFDPPNLNFYGLSAEDQKTVLDAVGTFMKMQPGFKDVWTFSDLLKLPFEREDEGRFYKLFLYRDPPPIVPDPPDEPWNSERRSGEVIFQSMPYNYVTASPEEENPIPGKRVGHSSIYNYDSHTSLFIYQAGRYAHKTITDPVMVQQFPVTLSEILKVSRPSAAGINVPPLPGINPNKSQRIRGLTGLTERSPFRLSQVFFSCQDD